MSEDKIGLTDKHLFTEAKFPDVVQELSGMSDRLRPLQGDNKADIIISFFKDHSIKKEYLKTNKPVTEMVLSGALGSYYTEEIFIAYRRQTAFLADFEEYIQELFAPTTGNQSPGDKWNDQVSKMKSVYTFLRDEDFRFDYGRKDVMLNSLQKKLGKDRGELNEMLEHL